MPINNIKRPEVTYMKINDLTLQKPGVAKEKEIKTGKTEGNVPTKENQLQRSPVHIEVSTKNLVENAKAKAMNFPEVREEKVAKLREQIQSGTYQVSNRELARAMIGTLLSEMA